MIAFSVSENLIDYKDYDISRVLESFIIGISKTNIRTTLKILKAEGFGVKEKEIKLMWVSHGLEKVWVWGD